MKTAHDSLTANPVLVEVWRGPLVESRHRGAIAVADPDGRLSLALGDVASPVAPRSAYKMLQALPLVASGAADAFGLAAAELALATASHSGSPLTVETVRTWLARLGLSTDDLLCGPAPPLDAACAQALVRAGLAPTRLHHNCSGKHAGFLTLARHRGVPIENYIARDHPVQREVTAAILAATGLEGSEAVVLRDGCGAPNLALPLSHLAMGLARFGTGAQLDASFAQAAARLRAAMLAHPDLVAGEGRACTALMRAARGRALVKAGAEGVYAAALPEQGLGIALKIDDGAGRAAQAAIAALLVRFGVVAADDGLVRPWLDQPIASADGVVVGVCRAVEGL